MASASCLPPAWVNIDKVNIDTVFMDKKYTDSSEV